MGNGNGSNGDPAMYCAECHLVLQPACRITLPNGRAVHTNPTCAGMTYLQLDAYLRSVRSGMSGKERQNAFAQAKRHIAGQAAQQSSVAAQA